MTRLAVAAVAALGLAGCVERYMIVKSRPAGAEVFIDSQFAGKTPLKVPFSHYGTHDILVRHPTHQSHLQKWKLSPPAFQWTPFDFFTEWMWPFTLTDQQTLVVDLKPSPEVTPERLKSLKDRAEASRADGKKALDRP